MTSKLLPCPFCGSAVELEQTESFYNAEFGVRKWWGVVCRSTTNRGGTCAIQTRPAASEEAAVARWNKRAPLSPDHSGGGAGVAAISAAEAFGKGFNLLEQEGGKYRITMAFQNSDDAFAAYRQLAELRTCLDKVKELNQ